MKFIELGATNYIDSVWVKDCFAAQDFAIPVNPEHVSFKHLILTGKNGSGKTTVLKGIASHLGLLKNGASASLRSVIGKLDLHHLENPSPGLQVFFPATRLPQIKDVKSPTAADSLETILRKDSKDLAPEIKQFLVNKKIAQAFSQIANRSEEVDAANRFFENLLQEFRSLFGDDQLNFEFQEKSYDFDFVFGDGRRVKFNQLPDGFSAFIWILMDLLMRVDAIRHFLEDFSIDPCGVVLIDEPELHLHLELQYRVLPILTALFPNVQFIVATHSPAVISSIKNTTVFDLTTKEIAPRYTPGAAFSELMQTHFGLENEFGPVADAIFAKAKQILSLSDKRQAASQLRSLLHENEELISPIFRLELESTIMQMEALQSAG